MKLLISACLLGERCRYDGGTKPLPADVLAALRNKYELVPVCPECLGGLPIPRAPSERRGDRVMMKTGEDVTEFYRRGAEEVLRIAEANGCRLALMKERSPSCGSGEVYDGTFSKTLVSGDGVAAALLKTRGIAVFGESRIGELP